MVVGYDVQYNTDQAGYEDAYDDILSIRQHISVTVSAVFSSCTGGLYLQLGYCLLYSYTELRYTHPGQIDHKHSVYSSLAQLIN